MVELFFWLSAGYLLESGISVCPSPLFRRSLRVDNTVDHAVLSVCGLGCYELYINGRRVGDQVLDPGFTAYHKRVLYSTYDVSDLLKQGENVLALMLGRGRYDMFSESVWGFEKAPWRDRMCFILSGEITFTDGSTQQFGSDDGWRCLTGPVLNDSLYAGETFDARLEPAGWQEPGFSDSDWEDAVRTEGPSGVLEEQSCPPMRIKDIVSPARITQRQDSTWLVDFGDVIAGWVAIAPSGAAGDEIVISYGEKLDGEGRIDCKNVHVKGRFQEDRYICRGSGREEWAPRFSYKGFRYVEIRGWPGELTAGDISARHLYTDVPVRGSFSCENELVNRIHRQSVKALCNNLHSIVTDTPTFEKNGWTGDAQLTCQMACCNFDMSGFYRKWLTDMRDSQLSSGEVAPIVPTSGWGTTGCGFGWDKVRGAVPAWDAALFEISREVYWQTADKTIIAENYEAMKRYFAFLESQALDGIQTSGLGDWLAPVGQPDARVSGIPPEGAALSSTAYYYRFAVLLEEFARILGHDEEAGRFSSRQKPIREAFNRRFFNSELGCYETRAGEDYRQTSNVLALAFGLVPETYRAAVGESLVRDVRDTHNGHLNTGILGTRYLFEVLTNLGEIDLAWEVLTQKTYPSYGFWFKNGYPSLGEAWELTTRSWSHHMYGSPDSWLYRCVAGIVAAEPGYSRAFIQPRIPAELAAAEVSLRLSGGTLSCSWRKEGGNLNMEIVIPSGCGVEVFPPGFPGKRLTLTTGRHTVIVGPETVTHEQPK